jgi:hypothetical protein
MTAFWQQLFVKLQAIVDQTCVKIVSELKQNNDRVFDQQVLRQF